MHTCTCPMRRSMHARATACCTLQLERLIIATAADAFCSSRSPQPVAPNMANVPSVALTVTWGNWHFSQQPAPSAALYDPGGHRLQSAASAEVAYWPAGQALLLQIVVLILLNKAAVSTPLLSSAAEQQMALSSSAASSQQARRSCMSSAVVCLQEQAPKIIAD